MFAVATTSNTPEKKVPILRRHLVDNAPVSTVCEEAGIHPSLLYQWQKQFFENGAAAFQPGSRNKPDQAQQRIAAPLAAVDVTTARVTGWTGRSAQLARGLRWARR